jgi:hypothetical protein
MWTLGLRPCNSFSGNICFKFLVLCLCGESTKIVLSLDNVQVTPALWWATSCCRVTSTSQRTTWLFTQTSLATSLGYVYPYVIPYTNVSTPLPPPPTPITRVRQLGVHATCPSKFPFFCAYTVKKYRFLRPQLFFYSVKLEGMWGWVCNCL